MVKYWSSKPQLRVRIPSFSFKKALEYRPVGKTLVFGAKNIGSIPITLISNYVGKTWFDFIDIKLKKCK